MYYVYELIDPRNNMPFYIGKGKGRRAKTHLWPKPETRNVYIEKELILKYGNTKGWKLEVVE
jgi:hypothetical protein